MTLLSDEAIVLRRFEYGETSLVAHLFARREGRVAVLAKGVHRPKSSFFGAVDLLYRLEVVWSHRPGRELQILTEADVLDARTGLRRDVQRYAAALYACELVGEAAREGESAPALYDAFALVLDLLGADRGEVGAILLVFELAFLRIVGLRPAFDACASCRGPLPGRGLLSLAPGAGGVVCGECAPRERVTARVPAAAAKVASSLASLALRDAARISLDRSLAASVRGAVDRFLLYHFERPPRARRYLSFPEEGRKAS